MSFSGKIGEKDLDVFLTTMLQLMAGYPVGAAMEYFNQRYTTLMAELIELMERSQTGGTDQSELANMWTATNDARNYIIIGDPAVRLRTGQVNNVGRPTIEIGLRSDSANWQPRRPLKEDCIQ